MKKTLTLLCCLFFTAFYANAQIFWTENFESGSTSGKLAGAYTGPNGTWVTSSTGTNGADHNAWFVSCAENGHTSGVCGTGCVATSSTATLATLHIGSNSIFSGVDNGASYDAGGICPIVCPQQTKEQNLQQLTAREKVVSHYRLTISKMETEQTTIVLFGIMMVLAGHC